MILQSIIYRRTIQNTYAIIYLFDIRQERETIHAHRVIGRELTRGIIVIDWL